MMLNSNSENLDAAKSPRFELHPLGSDRPPSLVDDNSLAEFIRTPDEVMSTACLGSLHPTRLSFARVLVRQMARENWEITRAKFDVDLDNRGEAIYAIDTPYGEYTFLAFAHHIDDSQLTDRAIANSWDFTFALRKGRIDDEVLSRLRQQVPKQRDAEFTAAELVFSRANKSGRLFGQVVSSLAAGQQPNYEWLDEVGYLIRTSAVFGNGANGIADYRGLMSHGAFSMPFAAQMFTVYLIREFSADLVDHLAYRTNSRKAVTLAKPLRRHCGIGNATGLGMVPFLVSHPVLIHFWTLARERALARVLSQPIAERQRIERFETLLARAIRHVQASTTNDPSQANRILQTRTELGDLLKNGPAIRLANKNRNYIWWQVAQYAARTYSSETRELVNSLIMEPNGDLVDLEEESMIVEDTYRLTPNASLETLKIEIERLYSWTLNNDDTTSRSAYHFWYRSKQNREPRLGIRGEDSGEDYELPLAIANDARALHKELEKKPAIQLQESIGVFLAKYPEHRATVERVQTICRYPYGEIRANLMDKHFSPIDLLRAKLAFFGATKFDPQSDRWLRITLMQGAPLRNELYLGTEIADDWCWANYEPAE